MATPFSEKEIKKQIEYHFAHREALKRSSTDLSTLKITLEQVLTGLEQGHWTVAHRSEKGDWETQVWLKEAILLYFQLHDAQAIDAGFSQAYDKVPLRFPADQNHIQVFKSLKTRVVPPACIRRGAYIGPNTVIMPSFINIGAHVGAGSMIDTWATVGSCAYLGKGVHLSGGAGIGGVLEPLQAKPTIIEDNCFIGARSEIAEGVVVGTGSVIGMGVFIGQSTKIYHRQTGETFNGYVPPYSVVVSGQLPREDGKYSLYAAIIVKTVDEQTRAKTGINELLRY